MDSVSLREIDKEEWERKVKKIEEKGKTLFTPGTEGRERKNTDQAYRNS